MRSNFFYVFSYILGVALAVLLCVLWFSIGIAYSVRHFRPAAARVTAVDRQADTVSCATDTGLVYTFNGAEDWDTGDVAALILYDNNTATALDDTVVSANYAGGKDEF